MTWLSRRLRCQGGPGNGEFGKDFREIYQFFEKVVESSQNATGSMRLYAQPAPFSEPMRLCMDRSIPIYGPGEDPILEALRDLHFGIFFSTQLFFRNVSSKISSFRPTSCVKLPTNLLENTVDVHRVRLFSGVLSLLVSLWLLGLRRLLGSLSRRFWWCHDQLS